MYGPGDDDADDWETAFWDRAERRQEAFWSDVPPDPGDPYDHAGDDDIEPEDEETV